MVFDSAEKNCSAVATWALHKFGARPKYRADFWKTTKRGLQRLHFRIPSQKKPVRAEHIECIASWVKKDSYDMFCVFVAFTVAWHALLRKSEFTMRSARLGFRASVDVTWGKVHWYPNAFAPETIEIELGICKGDQRRPTSVYLHKAANKDICPVEGLRRLFWWPSKARGKNDPAFVYKGEPLSPTVFDRVFRRVMSIACHVDDRVPHSLRVGGAQALQEAGAAPWVVQAIGRWRSAAWRAYCHADFRAVRSWARSMGNWREHRREYRSEHR